MSARLSIIDFASIVGDVSLEETKRHTSLDGGGGALILRVYSFTYRNCIISIGLTPTLKDLHDIFLVSMF